MLLRFLIEVITQARRRFDQGLHVRVLAVEDAQRIALQAPQAVLVQAPAMLFQVGHQGRAVVAARFQRAQGIELQGHIAQAEFAPHARRHEDQFRVDVGAGHAEHLDTDLVKLAVAALLRPLMAEHGTRIPSRIAMATA